MREWLSSPLRVGSMALALGAALGLLIGYGVWPVEYTDVDPIDLSQPEQEAYMLLVGQAFTYDGDLALARQRLAALGRADYGVDVMRLAEEYAARPDKIGKVATALEALAEALRSGSQ